MRRLLAIIAVVVLVLIVLAGRAGAPHTTATPTRTTAFSAATPAAPTATPLPTVPPTPTVVPQVVAVIDNPVGVRESASADATAFATLDVGTQLSVVGPDTTGADGATRWVHVAANGRDGYVRSDLVSPPRAFVPPTAAPVVLPTATATLTASQQIAQQNEDYPAIDAGDLAKRPDFYKGKRFRITGRAVNVGEQNGITAFTLSAQTAVGGTVSIAVGFQGTSTSIQENIRLTAYCVGVGTISGKNGFGATITEAACTADHLGPPT